MFGWFRKRRRERLLKNEFPSDWLATLHANVRHYRTLTKGEQVKLRDITQILVSERRFEGCDGFGITDEVKVTIAAQTALLVLGLGKPYYFERVTSILVYPEVFYRRTQAADGYMIEGETMEMLGESWSDGVIILSWPDVLEGGRNADSGRNLVLHEFAHHLDGLDGEMGGAPPFANRLDEERWTEVTEYEFERLVAARQRGESTLLDQYGAQDQAEFFAVATECFFEQGYIMREEYPGLYEVLSGFYQQDPARRWLHEICGEMR